jgi:hypothetical protein
VISKRQKTNEASLEKEEGISIQIVKICYSKCPYETCQGTGKCDPFKETKKLDVILHACNPSTWVPEAGKSQV